MHEMLLQGVFQKVNKRWKLIKQSYDSDEIQKYLNRLRRGEGAYARAVRVQMDNGTKKWKVTPLGEEEVIL